MSTAPEMVLSLRLEQRLSPELVAFAAMLALPVLELEGAVERELDENPALERDETIVPSEAGVGVDVGTSWDAPRPSSASSREHLVALSPTTDERERLRSEARILCREAEASLVDLVVDALDEHGFLPGDPDELAADGGAPVDALHRAIAAVRAAGPSGLAARNVRECLLLQLAELEASGEVHPLARELVMNHMRALARGSYSKIARALGVERADVLEARDFICDRLRPYPNFESQPSAGTSDALPLQPDVVIRELAGDPERYDVLLIERPRTRVRLNPYWERVLCECDTLPETERRFIESHLKRSRAFLSRLEQRRATLLAVSRYVVEYQRDFIRRGKGGLRPLTRTRVAHELCLHESTVSRAVARKNAQLPTGHIVPLMAFFESAGAAQEALALLVREESLPLSDGQLSVELAGRGFRVARRTVAKYRDQLGIPTHALR